MVAIDQTFLATLQANPHLRPRVGNPDEMRSNRMEKTLAALKFRVTAPEPGMPEDLLGGVITALNEEAVACAALGNKGGINLIVSYEAFASKMHGALRQEITFAHQCQLAGRPPRWLSVPVVLTSHTWENGKNEFSHQDPVMSEMMMNESSEASRVLFVPDANTAAAALRAVYLTQGEIWTLVVPKSSEAPDLFTEAEAGQLLEEGAALLDWAGYRIQESQLLLTAIGAYQLEQVLHASARLTERRVPHTVLYMLEPGRFHGRTGKARRLWEFFYPPTVSARIFVTHTRPEPLLGLLHTFNTGAEQTSALGFINRGGTLNTFGMLFVNKCTWAHILAEAARLLYFGVDRLLSPEEIAALSGKTPPHALLV